MSYDANIQIFGSIDDPKVLAGLAEILSREAHFDWDGPLGTEDVLDRMVECVEGGDYLLATLSGVNRQDHLFPATMAFCENNEISYVMQSGPSGEEDMDWERTWKPGTVNARQFAIDNRGPVVGLADLKRAHKEGSGAIALLIADLEEKSLAGVPRVIEFTAGTAERAREIVAEEASAPSVSYYPPG